jgi:RHH-type proline utilization regulon transcriptional repressor/proline dehydrogenase/delta 1-pyrroline-5-carboxylate dehydrogenase
VLAAKEAPIVPLIAETGGINPMIVDATALPEQVTDDAVASSFRSAGQRCSALRLLCVQEDVADQVIEMVAGAARELNLGDPRDPATHVGPVIDSDAKAKLDGWVAAMEGENRVRFRWDAFKPLPAAGTYVAPAIVMLDRARDLREEVFGPILHVVRWSSARLDALLDDIATNGYGLTLGIHSRIDATVEHIAGRLANGNVYVNRNMIGAGAASPAADLKREDPTTCAASPRSRWSPSIPLQRAAMRRCWRPARTERGRIFDARSSDWSILIRHE